MKMNGHPKNARPTPLTNDLSLYRFWSKINDLSLSLDDPFDTV
jgi:hypothetical protein